MLKLIKPDEHVLHIKKLEQYWERFCVEHQDPDYQDWIASITHNSNYILFELDDLGVVGGGLLLLQETHCTLTGVFFHIPAGSDLLNEDNIESFNFVCSTFYEGLVLMVKQFAEENNIELVAFENPADENEDIEYFGQVMLSDDAEDDIETKISNLEIGFLE